jgi:hypothetical protein
MLTAYFNLIFAGRHRVHALVSAVCRMRLRRKDRYAVRRVCYPAHHCVLHGCVSCTPHAHPVVDFFYAAHRRYACRLYHLSLYRARLGVPAAATAKVRSRARTFVATLPPRLVSWFVGLHILLAVCSAAADGR